LDEKILGEIKLLPPEKLEKIAIEVIKTMYTRLQSFPSDDSKNRNEPFQATFLQGFTEKLQDFTQNIPYFISLSSWLQGLNTTLGQSFFENVAHILSGGIKKNFGKPTISNMQRDYVDNLIADLANKKIQPNLIEENSRLFDIQDTSKSIEKGQVTADNYVEKDDYIEAIELKTVRPNAGVARGEKYKILVAKAHLKRQNPHKEVRFFIGFPFDPYSKQATGFDKAHFMKSQVDFQKFFDPNEVLIAGELWDKLSGDTNTMEQILDIINTIATPQFYEHYQFLANSQNAIDSTQEYIALLEKWFLFRELTLLGHLGDVNKIYTYDKKTKNIFFQPVFKTSTADSGKYNENRLNNLLQII